MCARIANPPSNRGNLAQLKRRKWSHRAFAEILGKLYFLQLPENLRRILLDYAQKRPGPANAAFNAAC
jgi:hypothetical protein